MVKPVSANASDEKIQNNKEEIEKAKPKVRPFFIFFCCSLGMHEFLNKT